ncbi:hypothetical protein I7I50_11301 [Histoplasma capsulatum G186AR]|uniref:Uncharacterized protein n=1 Tax=Ajellomyces capsulatus TaxID=5037 RepID=A0A8H7Z515_AJECA|nr:hypothetical protein I7I52_02539 [Histoplasma capsulatum]QSS69867.1 hypothetical protein I7I50_11301 [Histoplasma capsulatum G186AR]
MYSSCSQRHLLLLLPLFQRSRTYQLIITFKISFNTWNNSRYSSGPELFPLPSAMIGPRKERYLHESSHLKVTQRGGSLLLDGLSIMQISVTARNDRFRF